MGRIAVAGLALIVLAACSADGALSGLSVTSSAPPPVADRLLGQDGTCGALPEGASAPTKLDFGMTECDVVRIVGPVDKVEIAEAGGTRQVAATVVGGARPGLYRFEAGRLKSIEAAPEPPKGTRTQARAPARR